MMTDTFDSPRLAGAPSGQAPGRSVQSLARADTADIAIPDREQAAGALAHILATGDLAQLSNEQRVAHYLDICASLGLNPRSRPFDWLVLDNRLVLYPNKSCAEQLRRAHQISVRVLRREMAGELFCVTVEGRTPSGRTDESSKYVPVTYWDRQGGGRQRLVGDKLANAYAKAETGAKRRLVLSMVGLAGLPDQDEMTGGRHVVVDGTGAVLDHPSEQQRYLAATPSAAAAIGEPTYESTQATSGARSPLAGTASQAPTEDELAPPERPSGPAPTFKPSAEDVERWNKRWHDPSSVPDGVRELPLGRARLRALGPVLPRDRREARRDPARWRRLR